MPTMTAQDIFNTVAKHLFTQGIQAKNSEICQYRGPNNTSCAVGCLIPDQDYERNMEGRDVQQLLDSSYNEDASMFPQLDWLHPHLPLLQELQDAHDRQPNWNSTLNMRSELRQVAKNNDLDASILDTLSFKDR